MTKNLILVGSNSYKSINYEVAKKLQNKTNYDLISLKDFDVPIYSLENEEKGIPVKIKELEKKIINYEKIILLTPEHNGYLPSFLKNIFDWLSRDLNFKKGNYFQNQKLFIVSVSPGKSGGETVRKISSNLLTYSGAKIIGTYGIGSYSNLKNIDFEINKIINNIKN
ncbi:NAD(P)H-dependent oxidoreductase [Mycoplasmoides pirum]|uniref:NAD(P)H-dependent oxidoreductase n=1 Tax=Mycoplasmoides pirum TaxID=2122 RepID=UPI00048358CF|nr:NAD(P)H-dependent oxidoreductase [Mycoplasmoides pirum]